MNMHNDSVDAMTYYKKFTYDYLACQRKAENYRCLRRNKYHHEWK